MIDDYLPKKEAINLITDRIKKPTFERTPFRNEVRANIDRRIKNGSIRQRKELINTDDVLHFARQEYGEQDFKDIPLKPITGSMSASEAGSDTFNSNGFCIPEDVASLKSFVMEILSENERLRQKNIELNELVALLEPDASRFRDLCIKNSQSAKKKRTI